MNDTVKAALESQYLAALEMLGRAIDACPDALWSAPGGWTAFWYLVHHTLFWTDCYLSDDCVAYRPPPPFGLEELDPAGVLPPRAYAKDELRPWLAHCRAKAVASIAALTDETAVLPAGFPHQSFNRLELRLDNLRHVQHHVAQLQLLLRQAGVEPPRWVGQFPPARPPAPA